uniref:G_PROTEIN_RECEP_F1_2 domain-containing protein n=1 Tax=Macrostomum lignano TaxID=282301 RepID=A0A1I8GJP9_9PLAT
MRMIEAKYEELKKDNNASYPLLMAMSCVQVVLIVFGGFGNILLLAAVRRCRHLQRDRIYFVVNLAIFDVILCLFTQPFGIARLMQRYGGWSLGAWACKLVNCITGINMFGSSFSIAAIALDRMRCVLFPTRPPLSSRCLALLLLAIWLTSLLLSCPLLAFANAVPDPMALERNGQTLYFCSEGFDTYHSAKLFYSCVTLLLQFLLPLICIAGSNVAIHCRLQQRMRKRRRHLSQNQFRSRRRFRVSLMLGVIAAGFALAWLPLTVSNAVHDYSNWRQWLLWQQNRSSSDEVSKSQQQQQQQPLLGDRNAELHSLCLTVILVSPCINATVYGFFNDKLKEQYRNILRELLHKFINVWRRFRSLCNPVCHLHQDAAIESPLRSASTESVKDEGVNEVAVRSCSCGSCKIEE